MKYKNLSLDYINDEELETEMYLKGELVLVENNPIRIVYRSQYYHCVFNVNSRGRVCDVNTMYHFALYDVDNPPIIIYSYETDSFEIKYLKIMRLDRESISEFSFNHRLAISTIEQLITLKEMIENNK